MNHQLFEEWLLDDDPLTPVDEQKLESHLEDCAQCSALAAGWRGTQQALDSAPQVGPAPGFSARFQARLVEAREARQRRNYAIWISSALASGTLISAIVAYPTLSRLTFAEIIMRVVGSLGLIFTRASELGSLAGSLFQGPSLLVPLALWIGLALGITFLALLWVFTMWKIIVPKGVKA